MKNKKSILAATVAAVLSAAALSVPFVGDEPLEVGYEIKKESEYVTSMSIDVPDEVSADIAELYVNDIFVGKTLLPNGGIFKSNAIVFSDPGALKLKLYKLGEVIGTVNLGEGVVKK